jgi:hypothetical protein
MEINYIYIISNPAFPGWYKIGRTTNIITRVRHYQTADPHRGYVLEFHLEVKEPYLHEEFFKFHSEGEWIKGNLSTIIKMIKLIEESYIDNNYDQYVNLCKRKSEALNKGNSYKNSNPNRYPKVKPDLNPITVWTKKFND